LDSYFERPDIDKNTLLALMIFIGITVIMVDIPIMMVINLPLWLYLVEIGLIGTIFSIFISYYLIREIKINNGVLEIRFGVFRSKTPIKDIVNIEMKNPPLPALVPGIGYMFNYLVFAFNPTKRFIRIKRKRGVVKEIYFTASNEYQLLSIINTIREETETC